MERVTRLLLPGRPAPLLVGGLPVRGRGAPPEPVLEDLWAEGVRRVVCLVPRDDLDGPWGAAPTWITASRARFGAGFLHVPAPDYGVPRSESDWDAALSEVDRGLLAGESAFVHCMAGCGRTGTFAACLLVRAGVDPLDAIRTFHAARGCGPETALQVAFVAAYAARLAVGTGPG